MFLSSFWNRSATQPHPGKPQIQGHAAFQVIHEYTPAFYEALEKTDEGPLLQLMAAHSKQAESGFRKHKLNLEARNHHGDTLLLDAIRKGDYPRAVEKLLKGGANTLATDRAGKTAILLAAEKRRSNSLEKLLDFTTKVEQQKLVDELPLGPMFQHVLSGEDLAVPPSRQMDIPDPDGVTPLMRAIRNGHRYETFLLTEHQALVNPQDKHGNNALIDATRRGDLYAGQRVMKLHPNVALKDKDGKTALFHWVENFPQVPWYRAVGSTLLHRIRQKEWRFPAQYGFSGQLFNRSLPFIDEPDGQGRHLLSYIGESTHRNSLLGIVANLYFSITAEAFGKKEAYNKPDQMGLTPLMRLVRTKLPGTSYKDNAFASFLSQTRDINQTDLQGKSAPMHAAEAGNLAFLTAMVVVRSRLSAPAQYPDHPLNTNLQDKQGETLLMKLARLNERAYRNQRMNTQMGQVAFFALRRFFPEALLERIPSMVLQQQYQFNQELLVALPALLAEIGADPNLRNNQGESALMLAAVNGNLAMAKALLKMQASSELRNGAGQDALELAQANRHQAVVTLLKDHQARHAENV